MDIEQIKETPIWELYEKGRNFFHLWHVYSDAEKNYRFYNGNQWDHAKLGDIEPVQKNFIKPIVRYKVGIIHDNLYSIVYSSQNFENIDFRPRAEKICEMLNRKASAIWEKDKMDYKGRRATKDAAINDEGIIYVSYNPLTQMPENEIIKKVDIYYGDENNDDIQSQPYIIIRKRMSISNARAYAKSLGLQEDKLDMIIGDNDTFDTSSKEAKEEINDRVTILIKMYKKDGTVHYSVASRYVTIKEEADNGTSLYPVAHYLWEEKEGSSRGECEVRYLIPNQIEVNRTEMRRVMTVKNQAYPQTIADVTKIKNLDAINRVGGLIKVDAGMGVDDVAKVLYRIPPSQMSPDVKQLQDDLIQVTRDLAGAGDIATGQVNPETASGKAILAIQNAAQSPMTEQKESYKNFLEDLARIWLDILKANNDELTLENVVKDENTGEEKVVLEKVSKTELEALQASVKIDITPRSPYDRYAQELSIENMLRAGMFNIQKLSELKIYVNLLDDTSTMPKKKLEQAVKLMEEEQQKIAIINSKAQLMQQRASQFINSDLKSQTGQIADAIQAEAINSESDNQLPDEEMEEV